MLLKYKICCPISRSFKIEIVSRGCNDNGEPDGKVRIGLQYKDILINYCPYCGEKTHLEIAE